MHESWYIDYKAAPLQPRNYAKAISALANTYGGWVFIGVEEKSRDDTVAGAFPGVAPDQTDRTCQHIRQGVAEHLNPQPFFELRVLDTPETEGGEKIICIYVPSSIKAPIIHSDGRIYRRVNDASEPVAENNRDAVEHLLKRVERLEGVYRDWFDKDPELSKAEDGVSYLRIIAVSDYWDEKSLWLKSSTEEFANLLRTPDDGMSFSLDYGNIHSQQGGFVCRSIHSKDARQIAATFMLWRNLLSEFWLPLPSFEL